MMGGDGKWAINEVGGTGMIAIGDGRGMMDVGDGKASSLVTFHGGFISHDSSTLGDELVDFFVQLLGDLLVGDGDGGLLEVDVVEDCKCG